MMLKVILFVLLSALPVVIVNAQVEIDTRSLLKEMEQERGDRPKDFNFTVPSYTLFQYDSTVALPDFRIEDATKKHLVISPYIMDLHLKPNERIIFNLSKSLRFSVGLNWHYNIAGHNREYMPALSFSFNF